MPKEYSNESVNEALVKVSKWLRDGLIDQNHFDMNAACHKGGCGTVACIGGWAYLALLGLSPISHQLEKLDFLTYRDASDFVYKQDRDLEEQPLFYPRVIPSNQWSYIPPLMAADAIDNYLKDGDPRWEDLKEEYIEHFENEVAEKLEEEVITSD